jgi:hypothetical protein
LTGKPEAALGALALMRDNVWAGDRLPGPRPGDEEFCEAFSAAVLGYLRRGEDAEPHARNSLQFLNESGRYVQIAGSHLALARALLHRDRPDPEQAAAAITDALSITDSKEIARGRTASRAAGIYHRHLGSTTDWVRLPAVRDLRDRLPHPRELSAGSTV